MSKYWISVAAAVLWLATVGNTAEIEGSTEVYYYGGERVALTVVPDEMSVGQSGEGKLFNQATLQVEAGTVAVQTTQLGANTWRLRLDPQGSAKTSAYLQTGPMNRPAAPANQATKELLNSQRIERQIQIIDALMNDETVEWAYPAYRNAETEHCCG